MYLISTSYRLFNRKVRLIKSKIPKTSYQFGNSSLHSGKCKLFDRDRNFHITSLINNIFYCENGRVKNFKRNIMATKKDPIVERQKYMNMSLEEKRKLYLCGKNYVTLDTIPNWESYAKAQDLAKDSKQNEINTKLSLFEGDITSLEIDSIVNAANNKLMGGGGVDGAIHRAAGEDLKAECATLGGCETGDAKITGGYKLPAKYVIHTVGPIGEKPDKLASCYSKSLKLLKENKLRSIAFPCISTGVYGYPNEKAAYVAIETVKHWLEENISNVDRIIFCLFLKEDVRIYHSLMSQYFPV